MCSILRFQTITTERLPSISVVVAPIVLQEASLSAAKGRCYKTLQAAASGRVTVGAIAVRTSPILRTAGAVAISPGAQPTRPKTETIKSTMVGLVEHTATLFETNLAENGRFYCDYSHSNRFIFNGNSALLHSSVLSAIVARFRRTAFSTVNPPLLLATMDNCLRY